MFIPWAKFTLQDETAPDAGTQLMQAVSWFQSRQSVFSVRSENSSRDAR
ncbi:hypothetical protein MYA98_12255 [Salmonella sp. WGH-01]|nr:hypothetical protein MYA98_12255 [Salmonella sp. WGH-01]